MLVELLCETEELALYPSPEVDATFSYWAAKNPNLRRPLCPTSGKEKPRRVRPG
jgi:hypothetical protein